MKVGVASILSQSRSKLKLVLAGLGMFLSLVIISSVFQLYQDVASLMENSESEDGFEYIQISKEVGISTTLGLSSAEFRQREIEKIKSQDFIEDVGALYSNDFRVYGRFAGNAFDMFFTSVEDEFIDADLSDFKWEKGEEVVPVIVSNQFLSILNHAVLPSQGQAPIPKVAIKQATVNLALTKDGKRLNQKARVVGFSDRITSVLVPKNFLDYANKELAGTSKTRVSMLLLKVKDAGDTKLNKYLVKNDYEVSGEMPLLNKAKDVLNIAILVLLVFGGIILGLSIALNLSQFNLLIADNKARIQMLLLLGYSPGLIAKSIIKSASIAIGGVVVLSTAIVFLVFYYLHNEVFPTIIPVSEFHYFTVLIPLILSVLFIGILMRSIKKQIS